MNIATLPALFSNIEPALGEATTRFSSSSDHPAFAGSRRALTIRFSGGCPLKETPFLRGGLPPLTDVQTGMSTL
jgi:hypothetical protein